MDLFERLEGRPRNYLPKDGDVFYYGKIFSREQADCYFKQLLKEIDWQHDEVVIQGKRIVTKRKVAWHGDRDFSYQYSNTRKIAEPWTPILKKLKKFVEGESQEKFNACLLNLYHDGSESMAWHSDSEKELVPCAAIASVSLGAQRKFCFKHKQSRERVDVVLEHGSLLLMSGVTQLNWLHKLPPSKKVNQARINLTFRMMLDQ